MAPATIIEPTCGRGAFVEASLAIFPDTVIHGLEIQEDYIRELEQRFGRTRKFVLHKGDYFRFDWPALLKDVEKPIWIVGNPPWVTNSALGKIDSSNRPSREKQIDLSGFDAISGKSNFDISEFMIRQWMTWISECRGVMAVICKTAVARKILKYWWKSSTLTPVVKIQEINAKKQFDAAVSACVFTCRFDQSSGEKVCDIFDRLDADTPKATLGYADNRILADAPSYFAHRNLIRTKGSLWRSGIKHDCAKVLELEKRGDKLYNKFGDLVEIEDQRLFPLMKGRDVKNYPLYRPLQVLLPKLWIGEPDSRLDELPKTRAYLNAHKSVFEKRRSTIYKKGGIYSIFGLGDYSFQPWKVAISSLNKSLDFKVIGPVAGKPVMFDDTVYFRSFATKGEADAALEYIQQPQILSLLSSQIFWDDMRPIKTEVLNRIPISSRESQDASAEEQRRLPGFV